MNKSMLQYQWAGGKSLKINHFSPQSRFITGRYFSFSFFSVSLSLFACLSFLSVFLSLHVCLSLSPSLCLSVSLSVCLFNTLSISAYLCLLLIFSVSFSLSLCLSYAFLISFLSLSLSLSIWLKRSVFLDSLTLILWFLWTSLFSFLILVKYILKPISASPLHHLNHKSWSFGYKKRCVYL